MYASITCRSLSARTCVLLGGSGQPRPSLAQSRPLAALLRPLSPSSGATADAETLRNAEG
ncbi:hypothetical protein [Roseateles flavus]|uniref:Uncharacterized protein n=1 Tax=Roseateles flavus TaxID=3149041 RepID=A0ABV0GGA1_9BURK